MNMKGKWKESEMNAHERKTKEDERNWTQNERNMKSYRSTWNQQNNSSIHFRTCLRMDFGFMLDLEYADIGEIQI